MNARIIELLQQPSLMQANDLQLLEKQIEHTPYVQNVRALYLYGIHLYNPTRYKEVLTTTAAYTTDKKILYQFINKKDIEEVTSVEAESKVDAIVAPVVEKENLVSDKTSETLVENPIENKEESSEVEAQQEEDLVNAEEASKDVVITDETPALEKENEVESDLSLESIDENLTQNKEEPSEVEAQQEETVMNVEEGSKDVVITDNSALTEVKEELNKDVSFESIDDFLPQVKFEVPKNHHQFLNPPKFEVKEHKPVEIEEKPTGIVIEESSQNIGKEELNETHSLDFGPFSDEEETAEVILNEAEQAPTEKLSEPELTIVDVASEKPVQEESAWKPMSIDAHQPDALIGKAITPIVAIEKDIKQELSKEEVSETIKPEVNLEESVAEPKLTDNIVENEEQNIDVASEKTEEEKRPIFNVSFFGESIAMVNDEEKANKAIAESVVEEAKPNVAEIPVLATQEDTKTEKSNVRQFINTWQNWLKIDRSAEIEKDKEVKKQKAIDEFIENQPKITQLKDEASFVIKEKKEDISHLMTETLANLYLEQKLYSKAIKAFETLIAKHPEKTDYFAQKIEDIKEQRKA